MPLDEYQRKRDFAKTAEPAGIARRRVSAPAARSSGRPVRRPAPPRDPAPLRLPPRDRRRPRLVGGAEGPDPRSVEPPDGRPRRGPPDRVPRLRGRDPGGRVRRRRRDRLGLGHLEARGRDAGRRRGGRRRRAEVRAPGREAPGPVHDRPHEPARRATAPRTAFEDDERRAVAADPQARRRRRAPAGTPRTTRRASRPAARTTRSRPTRDAIWISRGAGGDGRDRPVGGDASTDAALHPADGGDPCRPRLPRRGLAVRGQVGRLPGRGGRARRRRQALHPQRQRRRDLLPEAPHAGDLDRRARGDRRRRGGGARRGRPAGLRPPPGGISGGDRRPEARLPGLRPPPSRRPVAAQRPARGAQAAPSHRAASRRPRGCGSRTTSSARAWPSWRPRKAQGLEGIIAKHRRSTLRARPARRDVAQDQDPAGAGARRRRLDARRGRREGARRGRRRRLRAARTVDKLRFAGKVGSGLHRDHPTPAASAWRPSRPTSHHSIRRRRRTTRAAGAATSGSVAWVRPELVIRAELGGWTRDDIVRQAAFKGLDEGGKPRHRGRPRATGRPATADRRGEAAFPIREDAAARGRQRGPRRIERGTADRRAEARRHPRRATPRRSVEAELAALTDEGTALWAVGGLRAEAHEPRQGAVPAGDGRRRAGRLVTKRDLIRLLRVDRPGDAAAPRGPAPQPPSLPNGAAGPGSGRRTSRMRRRGSGRGTRSGVEDRAANEHLVADRAATLAWLGNQAAFEIHAWTSRLDEPLTPTFALIDIDPGTDTTWDETLTLARLYRTALGHLGVRGYPKTTRPARHPGLDPVEPRTRSGTRATGSRSCRGPSARPCPTSCRGSGRRTAAAARPASTTRRTHRSRPWSRHMPSAPRPGAPVSAPIAGTSSTIRTCAAIAGRSGRSGARRRAW